MNTNILSKCLEELKKDQPNISYVIGILETLMEMNQQITNPISVIPGNQLYPNLASGSISINSAATEMTEAEKMYLNGNPRELQ